MERPRWTNVCIMVCVAVVIIFLFAYILPVTTHPAAMSLDEAAQEYLEDRNAQMLPMTQRYVQASWAYESDLTEDKRKTMEEIQMEAGNLNEELWQRFIDQDWPNKKQDVKDEYMRRRLDMIARGGGMGLSEEEFAEMNSLASDMSTIYSTGQVDLCVTLEGDREVTCKLHLEPELEQVLAHSRNYSELQEAWVGWRDVSGRLVRASYTQYVKLANKQAKLNNFTDLTEAKISVYETENFQDLIAELYADLLPLYKQLHAYVRRKLREEFGEDKVGKRGPIPAHLLGNMWGQSWEGIAHSVVPFPDKQLVDVSSAMKRQSYTPKKMFEMSDEFFQGLNLTAMSDEFWEHTIMEKPANTEMVCHASAWSFYEGDDFRIKMCTDVNMEKLGVVHHEMGHVQYYMQYNHQPLEFQEGANPGFHEAVGDALALSVMTPKHLYEKGLINSVEQDDEADINFLLTKALEKVAFLPFGYLIDSYRWEVFSGAISSDDLNCAWWDKRFELQGLKPPVQRSEEDFDPGAKYHVVADVPYIRYFVSFIIQFQFHKALCLKAGQYDPSNPALPLHRCDIDKSTEAGNALASMLQLGSSRPWPEALEALTGGSAMDVGVLREYFQPLEDWLTKDNADHEEFIGWEKDGEYCNK